MIENCVRKRAYQGEGKGQCDREMEKTDPPGLVLSETKRSGRKDFKGREIEKKMEGKGGWAMQGRAAVKGEERGIIGCEIMRLGLGFKRVQREKGGMLLLDQYKHVDLITYCRESVTNVQR